MFYLLSASQYLCLIRCKKSILSASILRCSRYYIFKKNGIRIGSPWMRLFGCSNGDLGLQLKYKVFSIVNYRLRCLCVYGQIICTIVQMKSEIDVYIYCLRGCFCTEILSNIFTPFYIITSRNRQSAVCFLSKYPTASLRGSAHRHTSCRFIFPHCSASLESGILFTF